MQREFWQRLKSRKFLMAVGNAVFIFINEVLGQPMDPQFYWQITLAVIAFVLGESVVDASHKQ